MLIFLPVECGGWGKHGFPYILQGNKCAASLMENKWISFYLKALKLQLK